MAQNGEQVLVVCSPYTKISFVNLFAASTTCTTTLANLRVLDRLRETLGKRGGRVIDVAKTPVQTDLDTAVQYAEAVWALVHALRHNRSVRVPVTPAFCWTSYSHPTARTDSTCFVDELCMAHARVATLHAAAAFYAVKQKQFDAAVALLEKACVYFHLAALISSERKSRNVALQDLSAAALYAHSRLCSTYVDTVKLEKMATAGPVDLKFKMLVAESYYEAWQQLDRACYVSNENALGAAKEFQIRYGGIATAIIRRKLDSTNYEEYDSPVALRIGFYVADLFEKMDPPDPLGVCKEMRKENADRLAKYELAFAGVAIPTDKQVAEAFPVAPKRNNPTAHERAHDEALAMHSAVKHKIKFTFKFCYYPSHASPNT